MLISNLIKKITQDKENMNGKIDTKYVKDTINIIKSQISPMPGFWPEDLRDFMLLLNDMSVIDRDLFLLENFIDSEIRQMLNIISELHLLIEPYFSKQEFKLECCFGFPSLFRDKNDFIELLPHIPFTVLVSLLYRIRNAGYMSHPHIKELVPGICYAVLLNRIFIATSIHSHTSLANASRLEIMEYMACRKCGKRKI